MMLKFDPLRFIADHAGMALADAISEAYRQGQQDAQPDTDCALKEFGNCSYSETGCSDCKVKMKIRNALSAQPEIVKCRDCKECWYSGTATIMEKVCEIYKCKFWDDRIVSQNGYCYMAERRTDDE